MAGEKLFNVGIKALIRNSEGKVLVLHFNKETQNRKLVSYWDIPGGRINIGETYEQTLKREVEEEIGITDFDNVRFLTATIANFDIQNGGQEVGLVLFVYEVDVTNPNIKLSDEHSQYEWVEPVVAGERLRDKFPQEFCDIIAALGS